jgi:predicted nucleic acid-binding protein
MVLYVDTSALVRRYVHGVDRRLVLDAMREDPVWCTSAITRAEAHQVLHQLATTPGQHAALWAALRADWDATHVVPLDDRCLARAVEVGATYRVRTVDALHLAAADRLPRPAGYLTFDRRQIPAAAALGLEVVAPTAQ